MHRVPCAMTVATLLVATAVPARAQDRRPDADRERAAAERTIEHGRRFRVISALGTGLSIAAMAAWDRDRTSGTGTAIAVGGMTALGLGLIGDFARYRGKSRLDALDRIAAGGVASPARAEAERALRQGRRLSVIGGVGAAMTLAMPFFPAGHRCGWGTEPDRCSTAAKTYLVAGVAAGAVGLAGFFKTRRAQSRLEAIDETPRASHGLGVAPLRDGVAATYSVAW